MFTERLSYACSTGYCMCTTSEAQKYHNFFSMNMQRKSLVVYADWKFFQNGAFSFFLNTINYYKQIRVGSILQTITIKD